MKLTILFLILLTMLGSGLLHAAETPATSDAPDDGDHAVERPTVGLVLGGGGARGAAHIGVLRELERMRIPIDAIAGTSIGAIVGGLYASGMSVDELEELVGSLDWADSFKDGSRREHLRYRRKQDDANYPINLELGLRDGELLLPKGVIQGQKLGLILRELTLDVSHVRDFDRLPIPYRAVASDIATGEAVVMGEGDLAHSIRASMSAPGIFAPVKIGDRTLVDGGLVGNVPVQAMRDLGVDIIIAVDVEFPLYQPEELKTAVSISAQVLTILIQKETRRQLALLNEQDFLIRPQLGEYGSTDFARITTVIEPGAEAARLIEDDLSVLSLDEQDYANHISARSVQPIDSKLDFVRVRDHGGLSPRVLESRLRTRDGDSIDTKQLAGDASRIYGLRLYEQVDYRIIEEDGRQGVEFDTRAKSWGPNFLQFGLSLQDDLEGDTAFNVAARLTRSGINALGAEWRTDLQLGTDPFLVTEFYQPLSFSSRYFLAPRIGIAQWSLNTFQDSDNVARFRVTEGDIGLDVGRELGLWGEFRLGVFRGVGDADQKVGPPGIVTDKFETGGVLASFNVDTLDNAFIPLKGARVSVDLIASRTGLGADSSFELFDSNFLKAWTHGRHTLNTSLRYATSRDSDTLVRNYFRLGGFLNLSGLARGEISGPHAALARLVYYRRSGELKGSFDTPLYVGASLEAGNVWQAESEISFDSALINGSLFIGADTYIGTVFFAAGFGEGGDRSLYLSIGNSPAL